MKLSTLRASASAALAPLAEETRRSLKFACDAAMEAASPAVERAAAALAAASPSASKNRLDALEAQGIDPEIRTYNTGEALREWGLVGVGGGGEVWRRGG